MIKKNFVHSSSVILNDDCYILAGKIALDVSYHISFNTCKKNKILFISLSVSFLVVIPRHICLYTRCIIPVGKKFDAGISLKAIQIN